MGVVPVVCRTADRGGGLADALQRSGVMAPIVPLDRSGAFPAADAYVVVDEAGLPVSRELRLRVGSNDPRTLGKTIAYAPSVPARDIAELERIGIRYYCNSNSGIAHLFKLIGQIKADILLSARERSAEAEAVAVSVFQQTAASLELFAQQTTYDRKFYTTLSDNFTSKIRGTSLFLLVEAISKNQDTTIQHCALVTTFCTAFAASLGFPDKELERVFLAGFFHDIGKSAIPKSVIDKPGKLTDDEMRMMRTHVTVGHALLSRFPETAGETAEVALSHHEYLDGSGYPQGLRGTEIADIVRIVTIADIYAALVERRAYKPPFPPEKAFAILREMDGKLDQDLVTLFEPIAQQMAILK